MKAKFVVAMGIATLINCSFLLPGNCQTISTNCDPAPAGIVSWWPAEGNADDIVGGNNGTGQNIVYAPGEVGNAFYFNGSNSFVSVTASSSLNAGTGSGFTFETWINPTTINSQAVAEWNDGAGDLGAHLFVTANQYPTLGNPPPGCLYANLVDTTGASHPFSTGANVIVSNSYQHVALTYDEASGVAVLYCNGVAVQSANLGSFTPQTSYSLYLGARVSGFDSGAYFGGVMDEPSLYNRPLSAAEIAAIYNAGSAGKCPLVTNEAPAINSGPQSQTNNLGSTVSFTVSASGSPALGYQWFFNNTTPVGGNSPVLMLSNIQLTDAGSYQVVLTNAYGSATSSVAMLTVVVIPPTIAVQPKSQTNYVGSNITFSVTAIGSPTLSYQWLFNQMPLIGKTGPNLELSAIQFINTGIYSVLVTNVAGAVTSSNATLTVLPIPPCAPITNGLVSWWRAEGNMEDNWDSNDGGGHTAYAPGKVGQCFFEPAIRVTNAPSLMMTNGLTIEAWVKPTLSVIIQPNPTPQTIVSKYDYPPIQLYAKSSYYLGLENNSVIFKLSANGSPLTNQTLLAIPALTANQWTLVVATYDGLAMRIYLNGTLVAETNYSGGIFPGMTDLGIGANPYSSQPGSIFGYGFSGYLDEVTLYKRALMPDEIQEIYNANFIGKCLEPPVITTQPQSQAIPLGEDVKFTVSVTGSRPVSYQWRFSGPATQNSIQNIHGATNATLILEKLQAAQAGFYSVLASNSVGSAISSNAQLTLLPAPVCTPPPEGLISWWPMDTLYSNYQVNPYGETMNANNIVSFSGTTFPTGKVAQAFSFNGHASRAVINSSSSLNFGTNSDFSIEMWVKVLPPTISQLPNFPNVPVFEKRLATQVTQYGVGYSLSLYQGRLAFWLGDSPRLATNVSSYISSGPDLRDSMFHHVAVSVQRGGTNGGNLYVDGQLVMTFDPTAHSGSLSNNSPLYIGAPTITLSNSYFSGLIDEPAIYDRALHADEILAIRTAGAAGKCKEQPVILDQPNDTAATIGSNVTFAVRAAGTPLLRYQWFLNNNALIVGGTNENYAFIASNSARYSVRVFNLFGYTISRTVTLAVYPPPIAFSQTITLNEDTPTVVMLSGTHYNGAPLAYSIVTPPSGGSLSGTPPNLVYTPAQCFTGGDGFTFLVYDGLAYSVPATVSLNVQRVANTITALPLSVALNMNTSLSITLVATNTANHPLTYSVGRPAHGNLAGTPPNLVYTPDQDYYGHDAFTYSASDCQTNSNIASVSIRVNHPPQAVINVSPLSTLPGVTNLLVISTNNINAAVVLDGSKSFDVDGDPLTYFWSAGTNFLSTDVVVTNVLDLGSYDFILSVSDGLATNTTDAAVEVLAGSDAVSLLAGEVLDANQGNHSNSLLASLNAAAASFERGSVTAALNQLGAFQNKVSAQIAPSNPTLAQSLIAGAQAIIDRFQPPSGLQ